MSKAPASLVIKASYGKMLTTLVLRRSSLLIRSIWFDVDVSRRKKTGDFTTTEYYCFVDDIQKYTEDFMDGLTNDTKHVQSYFDHENLKTYKEN